MALIKFNNTENIYDINLSCYSIKNNRMKLQFYSDFDTVEPLISLGFVELNEHNLIVQSDFSNQKYIYRIIQEENVIITTESENDVWIEPVPNPPTPEYEQSLQELKELKITELSYACSHAINSGVDVEIDGVIEHFSYATAEDQANIKELFDGVLATGMPAPFHSDGNECKLYSAQQIIDIYVACATLKTGQTTYYNQLKSYVETLETKQAVKAITYGQGLTGKYLDTFNSLMASANDMMQALIAKRTVL